jgi:hypothetical protein
MIRSSPTTNLIPIPWPYQFTGNTQNTSFGVATYVDQGDVADCYQAYTTIAVRAVHTVYRDRAPRLDLHAIDCISSLFDPCSHT